MNFPLDIKRINAGMIVAWLFPAVTFWVVLAFEVPFSFTKYFHLYFPLVFLGVFILFYFSFRLKEELSVFTGFSLVMLLFALTISFLWTSGFSDNFLIGGLLPYKDAKNYYFGANLLLNGLPIRVAGQAVGRPLFPGFLSSVLLLTGQNLKITLAVLVQLAGLGLYLSARQVRYAMGALSGALYVTFLYFYFQSYAGYAISETLGFIGGCFAFALLWHAAEKKNWFDLLLGLGLLMVAVSARAGAFFVFPLLTLWAGWAFRGTKRFSLFMSALALVVTVAGYFAVNTVYPRLLGVPEGSSFGNFAYTVYGQVRGGAGWHSAIDELGTRNSERVYQAAWNVFLEDPSGLMQGAGKAFADFFLPGPQSVFVFGVNEHLYWLDLIFWGLIIFVLLKGLYHLTLGPRSNNSTLLLAGFIGILLSIPFLPPIDGGNRFYASTMPFFFAVMAAGAGRTNPDEEPATIKAERFALRTVSVSLLALTVLLPPVTLRARALPELEAPACSAEQRPFAVRINPGSYIDLHRAESSPCGLAPDICLGDFRTFNTEMGIDDFYQELDTIVASSQTGMRILPTINLHDGYFQYFVFTDDQIPPMEDDGLVSGCAVRIQTENQRIFLVDSILVSHP